MSMNKVRSSQHMFTEFLKSVSFRMSELIETINSDEEVDYLDDSEDEFQEKIFTKKDREEMYVINHSTLSTPIKYFSV